MLLLSQQLNMGNAAVNRFQADSGKYQSDEITQSYPISDLIFAKTIETIISLFDYDIVQMGNVVLTLRTSAKLVVVGNCAPIAILPL